MPLYTRTGDDGFTGLFGGGRVGKDHPRVAAYGTVDELNACLGVARAMRPEGAWAARFARMAVEEHASIAAFARTICQLMALGAPARLLADTQRALGDEIEHATSCLSWVEALGGEAAILPVIRSRGL